MFERLLDRAERQFNTSEAYIAMWLVGSVIAFLYLLAGDMPRVFLVAYLTAWVMTSTRIVWERRYFQRYDSILASSQFVGFPFVVIALGLLMANQTESILVGRYSFVIQDYEIVFMHTTIFALPHLLFQSYIFWKIHRKEWLGFAVHRKLFRTRAVPFVLHTAVAFTLTYIGWKGRTLDPISIVAIFFWIFSLVKYYVLRRHILHRQSRRREEQAFRATHSNAFLSDYLHRPPRRNTRSGNGRNRIRTSQRTHRPRTNIAEIEPGREITTKRKPRNGKTVNTNNLMPMGHVKREGLACTICYEPIRSSDGKIVLCPHCKFPAHETEWKEWRKGSDLCPRCSKRVNRLPAKLRLDASKYSQAVLKKLK